MKKINNIFLSRFPSIDLHGYDKATACVLVNDFIAENIILRQEKIVIIHGIGEGILKREIHQLLKKHKNVLNYQLDGYNIGVTVATLTFN